MGEARMNTGLFVNYKKCPKSLGVVEKVEETTVFVRWLEAPDIIKQSWDKYFFDEEMRNEPIGYPSAAIEIRAI
jgi:hypothetical protein